MSAKAKHIPTRDPEILLLNKYPREISAYVQKNDMNKNVQTSIIQKKKNPKNLKTIQMSVNRMNVIIYSSIQQNTMVVENNQYTAYNHMDKPHRCYIA